MSVLPVSMFRKILDWMLEPITQRFAMRIDHLRRINVERSARLTAIIDPSATIHETTQIVNLLGLPGAITIGANTHLRGQLLVFWNAGKIQIGDFSYIGDGSRVWSQSSISIGNHVLISHGVDIHDTDSHPIDWQERRRDARAILSAGSYYLPTATVSAPIVIEDDVWIGLKSTILKGVRLGRGAIVAAGSVVTKDVEPWTIVAGNPAQTIRRLAG